MIRIPLAADDVARVRIADAPDFGYEFVLGGYTLANPVRTRRLAAWRHEVVRRVEPETAVLFDFYTPAALPGFFKEAVALGTSVPAEAPDMPTAAEYLRALARSRALTSFTRAVADGHPPAQAALGRAVAGFQAAALDPYRRQISALVASTASRAAARAAESGIGALLRALHPNVHWDGTSLDVDAVTDGTYELRGRALVLRPSALSTRPTVSGDTVAGHVVLSYPATGTILGPDSRAPGPSPTLRALLGATRAAALVGIARTPAVTTGRLAEELGVSASAASRHAGVLHETGLITSTRDGMTVRHELTRLGRELLDAGPEKHRRG